MAVASYNVLLEKVSSAVNLLDTVQNFALGAGVAYHGKGLLGLLSNKMIRMAGGLEQGMYDQIDVGVEISRRQLLINYLQGHAGVLSNLGPQVLSLFNYSFDSLFWQSAVVHGEQLLVELSCPFDDVKAIKHLVPILGRQIRNGIPPHDLRIGEWFLRRVVGRGHRCYSGAKGRMGHRLVAIKLRIKIGTGFLRLRV